MQAHLAKFEEANIAVLAISADSPTDLEEKLLPKGIRFPLLSDTELKAIDAYGLRHENGNPFGGDISRPAVILIDEEGRIVKKMLTENWRIRPTAEMILSGFNS